MITITLKDALSRANPGYGTTVSAQELVSYFERLSRRKYLAAVGANLLCFAAVTLVFNLEHMLAGFTVPYGLLVLTIGVGFPLGFWCQTRAVRKMPIAKRLKLAAEMQLVLLLLSTGLGLLTGLALLARSSRLQLLSWTGTGVRDYLLWASLVTIPLLALFFRWAARKLAIFLDPYHLE
jgi:hypothetical protein